MMISEAMSKALNTQVNNEFGAAYAYLQMSYEFDGLGLKVFSARFRTQASEEQGHALKIADFIQECGGVVSLGDLPKPNAEYGAAMAIVEAALASELRVTGQINGLVDLAMKENDHATHSFLKWFVDEQVEEVSSISDLLQIMKVAGESNLFLVEQRLEGLAKSGE